MEPQYPRVVLRVIPSVDNLLHSVADIALTRSSLILGEFHAGWTDGAATVWTSRRGGKERVTGSGPAAGVAALLDQLMPELPPRAWFSLPQGAADGLAAHRSIARVGDWELRWLTTPPPEPAPRVDWLPSDSAEVEALIDSAYPGAEARPGGPEVRGWAAIRGGAGELLAAGADTSGATTGRISAVMTAPDARGRGYGAAVTSALCRRMLTEFDLVILGLYLHNDPARRMYQRIGFDHAQVVTSGKWTAK
jgi:ribosomal protein S18 acetylase RimI-like enzyme